VDTAGMRIMPGLKYKNLPDTKWSRLLRWQAGETPGPWEMSIYITNRCNLKCVMCWERWAEKEFGMGIYDKKFEVDDERLLLLVDESAELGVREWTVMGAGEVMVRGKTAMAMCRRIKELGMFGILHTNATLFKERHFEELVDIGWDRIKVSLDGADIGVNDAMRSRGAFNRTMECLRALKSVRDRRGVAYPELTVHPVMSNLNFDKLDQIVALAHSFGASTVGFSHLIGDFDGVHELELNAEQRAALPEHLRRAKERADALGVVTNADFYLRAEQGNPPPRPTNQPESILNSTCYEAWLSLFILVDGKAGPCCVFYDEHAENIRDKTLKEIWTGPYMQHAREVLGAGKELHYCKDCPSYIPGLMEQVAYKYRTEYNPLRHVATHSLARRLLGRTVSSLREQGVKQTLARAREWVQLRTR